MSQSLEEKLWNAYHRKQGASLTHLDVAKLLDLEVVRMIIIEKAVSDALPPSRTSSLECIASRWEGEEWNQFCEDLFADLLEDLKND